MGSDGRMAHLEEEQACATECLKIGMRVDALVAHDKCEEVHSQHRVDELSKVGREDMGVSGGTWWLVEGRTKASRVMAEAANRG